ncbi:hypothetical protein LEP1GSC047_1362 [Leptospira inadai serovar Lyme str. 10]|uniref:Zinc ribbon domain-containing protein n=3 Tax=Leptospira inadai TaxID=29506 RepID=V6H9B3_9LEPT|nr:hypothetical protein LEP1GSC047_1362 [Leptospira inadai serovar Lyme str. 10]PNV76078.1 hypothetical protein BES34_006165 [Leptospira inadai serovar Lyme]
MSQETEEVKKQVSCRNCGSLIPADSDKCVFCAAYQVAGRVPIIKFFSESRFFRRVILYPFSLLFAIGIPIFYFSRSMNFPDKTWVLVFSFFWALFCLFGYISEWIFMHKARGEAKDFRQGFFEWQKKLFDRSPSLSYGGMFLFVCVPLIDWVNPIPFSLTSSAIWTVLLIFLIKILFPLF